MATRTRLVLCLFLLMLGGTLLCLRATRTFSTPEKLLANWQRAVESARSVQGSVHLWHYDPVWGDKESEGEFWYTADHRGAYFYRPLPPGFAEDWQYVEWDKNQIKIVDHHARTITIIECPLARRTQIANGLRQKTVIHSRFWGRWAAAMARFYLPSEHLPLILPREGKFWADEFQWKPVPGLPNYLTAEPLDTDEKYMERFDLILDPRTNLPVAVQKHELGPARSRVVTVVDNLRLNAKSLPNLGQEIDETSPKWKITRESLPQTAKAE